MPEFLLNKVKPADSGKRYTISGKSYIIHVLCFNRLITKLKKQGLAGDAFSFHC